MFYKILLFMLISYIMQEKQNPLANTKWEYKVADGCVSYISFKKDMKYIDYNCEMDYPYSGKYEIVNDTIYLIELDLISNLPNVNKKNNFKKVVKRRIKLIKNGDSLLYFSWEAFENKKWAENNIISNKIFYKKIIK